MNSRSIDKNTPIYIAGHTGLIGSACLRLLRSLGHEHVITRTRAELELREAHAVESFFKEEKPQLVILAAGHTGGILENSRYPADLMANNLSIQQNVMQAAAQSGVEKLIFFASSCMYPRNCVQPMREDRLLTGTLESSSQFYATAKLAGLQLCLALNRQYEKTRFLPVIPNTVYGPHANFDPESSHVLEGLIRRFHDAKAQGQPTMTCWGTGKPKREFVHADDVARACYHIFQRNVPNDCLPINIGVSNNISIRDLASLIANTVGFTGTIEWDTSKPDGAPQKLLDSTRLFELGWNPSVDLETGIAKTYKWFCNDD